MAPVLVITEREFFKYTHIKVAIAQVKNYLFGTFVGYFLRVVMALKWLF